MEISRKSGLSLMSLWYQRFPCIISSICSCTFNLYFQNEQASLSDIIKLFKGKTMRAKALILYFIW